MNATSAIQTSSEDLIVRDLISLFCSDGVGSCCYVSQIWNQVAHSLAKLRFHFDQREFEEIPGCIAQLVANDLN